MITKEGITNAPEQHSNEPPRLRGG
jgi:hypothetical protein